ncbi:EpsG family protein [Halomonas saccharevitans]|uniref:EpsG family protein n=1 Tax=Halomonas saccharevitans TaxID=416872 RepID=A0A1I7CKA5_9GAMM|nr:EpsG family protein [Halomonas saccharevitans]SFT99814.1 EpsG family protein [Halomonas saccharevitans]
MIPYFALLIIVVAIVSLGRSSGSNGVQRCSLVLVGLMLIFFAGLRDRTVGTDTGTYVSWLSMVTSYEEALDFHVELGFSFIVMISSSLSDNYAILLVLVAALVVGSYLSTIGALVKNYEFAIFIFITLGAYTFFFNAARQGLAVALCFFALPYLLERKTMPYFILIATATLFHATAVIAAPLYFLSRANIGLRDVFIVVVGTAVLAISISSIAQFATNFLDERYADYGQEGGGGGQVQVAFLAIQGALLLLFKEQINEQRHWYCRLLNIYLLGLIPALASVVANVNPSGVLRITAYFSHTSILLWPMVLMSFKQVRNRNIFLLGFLACSLIYYMLTTSNFSGLYPYRLNPRLLYEPFSSGSIHWYSFF